MALRFKIALALPLISSAAMAADPVVGTWKTQTGEISVIERCGSQYCIVAQVGPVCRPKVGIVSSGRKRLQRSNYRPSKQSDYNGKLTVSGDSLKLQGCATSVLCKTQTWTRTTQ